MVKQCRESGSPNAGSRWNATDLLTFLSGRKKCGIFVYLILVSQPRSAKKKVDLTGRGFNLKDLPSVS